MESISKASNCINMGWPEVIVFHPPELNEALAHFLFESGALALNQDQAVDRPGTWFSLAGFKPGQIDPGLVRDLSVFLTDLSGIFELDYPLEVEWRTAAREDWAEKWKEGLAPLKVGRGLVIKPTWCEYHPDPEQIVVELDPGLAFGTGHHASTFMCLKMLESLIRSGIKPARILDVGAGSGILALAAAALGLTNIYALDNDPQVLPVAAENLAANGFLDRVNLVCSDLSAITGAYDLILANLTANDLIALGSEISRLASPGARLIVSGILDEQAEEVAASYERRGFKVEQRLETDEWVALALTGKV